MYEFFLERMELKHQVSLSFSFVEDRSIQQPYMYIYYYVWPKNIIILSFISAA